MFRKFSLDLPHDIYTQLSATPMEEITTGRWGCNLVHIVDDRVPLVRTTTPYTQASIPFSDLHHTIVHAIQATIPVNFNNILAERYDYRYLKMGYHSDQSLDLDEKSYIALYSCYNNPNTAHLRHLKVRAKETTETLDITLEHNSVVLFSIETNSRYQHAIVAPSSDQTVQWLGLTLRQAKTYLTFCEGKAMMGDVELTLATESERKEFFAHRKKENTMVGYSYPTLTYTLSPGDLLVPK